MIAVPVRRVFSRRSSSDIGDVVFRPRQDVKAEHHSSLDVLGNMAMGHPDTGVGYVEQDVDGLAGADEYRILPRKVGLGCAVPREDQESTGAMNVKRVVHRVIRLHFVDESDLHTVADGELPSDCVVLCPRRTIDQGPDHVARV